jgi:hypothetical protein
MHRRQWSRRTFLRAAGVAIGLPALGSLLPGGAFADPPPPNTKRFIALFFPNGSTMRQDWMLGGSGSNYTMGTAHTSLLPLQSKISMFQDLNGNYGGAPDHSRGTAEFLTGAPISNQNNPQVDTSIDQVIAAALDPQTPIRTLHLGPALTPTAPRPTRAGHRATTRTSRGRRPPPPTRHSRARRSPSIRSSFPAEPIQPWSTSACA